MRRRRGVWILALLLAAASATAVRVHASSAAPARAGGRASVDATYSCLVRRQHYVDVVATATLPPVNGQPRPGFLSVTTTTKTITRNGVTSTLTQVGLSSTKNSLRVDTSSCRRVRRQIPLTAKGLPGPPTEATSSFRGFINRRCTTPAARVLVRLQLRTNAGTPTHALLAIRNDDAKSKPIALYNWTPHRLSAYTGRSCVSTG